MHLHGLGRGGRSGGREVWGGGGGAIWGTSEGKWRSKRCQTETTNISLPSVLHGESPKRLALPRSTKGMEHVNMSLPSVMQPPGMAVPMSPLGS